MRYPSIRPIAAAVSLLALAGCDQIDPLERPYMWHESGSNLHNVAAMAANPADLTHGRGTSVRRAVMDSDSVDRMWSGKSVPLPSDTPGTSSGGTTTTGGGGAGGGGASGGGT